MRLPAKKPAPQGFGVASASGLLPHRSRSFLECSLRRYFILLHAAPGVTRAPSPLLAEHRRFAVCVALDAAHALDRRAPSLLQRVDLLQSASCVATHDGCAVAVDGRVVAGGGLSSHCPNCLQKSESRQLRTHLPAGPGSACALCRPWMACSPRRGWLCRCCRTSWDCTIHRRRTRCECDKSLRPVGSSATDSQPRGFIGLLTHPLLHGWAGARGSPRRGRGQCLSSIRSCAVLRRPGEAPRAGVSGRSSRRRAR